MAQSRFYGLAMLSALLFFTGVDVASAGKIKLQGTISRARLQKQCLAQDGLFSSSRESYACSKGGNNVTCDPKGKCTGECPNCGAARVQGQGDEVINRVIRNRPTGRIGRLNS
jgi:hypothetical protein